MCAHIPLIDASIKHCIVHRVKVLLSPCLQEVKSAECPTCLCELCANTVCQWEAAAYEPVEVSREAYPPLLSVELLCEVEPESVTNYLEEAGACTL